MAKITLVELTKYFGRVCAVNRLNLVIGDGEFLAIVGPSGCGKTTTLNCIAGLEQPDGGTIYFDDQTVNDLPPKDRDIAMVFQDYALYPHMTVYDNMAFALRVRRISSRDIESRVRRAAGMLGIEALLDRRPVELSGGQRQRVAVARAIVRDPVVFLMDEPLSNLDAALRVSTRTELKALQMELETTTVYVTHDQEEAMVLSDRIAILREGILQQCGTPQEVYRKPVNIYVATFIGSPAMNLIPGRYELQSGEIIFAFADGVLRFAPAEPLAALVENAPNRTLQATIGIRPEGMVLEHDVGRADVCGSIVTVEPVGPDTYVTLQTGSTLLKARCRPDDSLIAGAKQGAGLRLIRDQLHVFDAQTGLRLCTG